MQQTVYIKAPQCIEITNPQVYLKDFLTIYCSDAKLKEQLDKLPFYTFESNQNAQLIVSVLKIIAFITERYPDACVENLGEGDFILSYQPKDKSEKCKERIFTFFICLIAFFGGGYAIMAYNTDVGAKELFSNLSMLFLGNPKSGILIISIAYSMGLTIGMLLFFNHLGNKKLTADPTPLEVQMRLYEKDVSTTIIKDTSRRNENMDIS